MLSTKQNQAALTQREKEILYLLSLGKTFDMIARILDVKERTIKAHVANIKHKTNLNTLFQLGCYFVAQSQNIFSLKGGE